jgi:hypothetical protein
MRLFIFYLQASDLGEAHSLVPAAVHKTGKIIVSHLDLRWCDQHNLTFQVPDAW